MLPKHGIHLRVQDAAVLRGLTATTMHNKEPLLSVSQCWRLVTEKAMLLI